MHNYEGPSELPLLYTDNDLESYIGALYVDTAAIADLPAEYDTSFEQLGIEAICFSTRTTEYDPDTGVLSIGVLDENAPANVINPPHQHRSTLAHRSVPASRRPQQYFAKRSQELPNAFRAMLLQLAVNAGYRSLEMQDLHTRRSVGRGFLHVFAGGAAITGVYMANEAGFLDTPVGVAMTGGGLLFVAGVDALAVSESYLQEDKDIQALTQPEFQGSRVASSNLVRINPPGFSHSRRPTTRHSKHAEVRRSISMAAGSSIRARIVAPPHSAR